MVWNRIAPVSGSLPDSSTRPRSTRVRITPSQFTPRTAGHAGPADRLAVRDDRQRLQRRLGEPDLLAITDEPLDDGRTLGPGVEPPAAGDLAQVEPALLGCISTGELAQFGGDRRDWHLEDLGQQVLGHRLVGDQQHGLQAHPERRRA